MTHTDQSHTPPHKTDTRLQWLPPTLTALTAVALYAYTLRLPLYRDAMVMLRWMDHRSIAQLWVDAQGFPYYRPLAWMFLKAFQLGPGQFHTTGLHVQNVALHALDGALISLLAWRLWNNVGRGLFALLTGLIFVSFPFSYEVVPHVGPIFQLVVTALMAGATLLYWESRMRNSRALAVASLALGLACPFASEYGATLGLLLLALEWLESRRGRFQRFSWRPLVYLGLAAAYLLVWFLVPKSRGLPLLSLTTLGQKGTYFLQGLIFPPAPLLNLIAADSPTTGYGAVFALAALTLGLLAAFSRYARRGREMVFSLVWFAVGVLPLWPTLDLDYVLNGPRLFYIASAGIAMLWAGLVTALATSVQKRWIGQVAGITLALVILAGNATFLARMRRVLTTGGDIAADTVATATAHEDDTPLLLVNLPSWLSPKGYRFPLGWEGISILPGYSDVADLVYVNSGRQMNLRNVAAPIVWKEWPLAERFYTAPTGLVELALQLRWAERVFVVQNGEAMLRLAEAGWIATSPPTDEIAQATFADRVSLRLGGLEVDGNELTIRLDWWQDGHPERDETAFLHIYGRDGRLVAQADGYPLLGLYPSWLWQEGEVVHDFRTVSLPADRSGPYTIGAGIYEIGGARLSATDAEGNPLPDDVAIVATFERP